MAGTNVSHIGEWMGGVARWKPRPDAYPRRPLGCRTPKGVVLEFSVDEETWDLRGGSFLPDEVYVL